MEIEQAFSQTELVSGSSPVFSRISSLFWSTLESILLLVQFPKNVSLFPSGVCHCSRDESRHQRVELLHVGAYRSETPLLWRKPRNKSGCCLGIEHEKSEARPPKQDCNAKATDSSVRRKRKRRKVASNKKRAIRGGERMVFK